MDKQTGEARWGMEGAQQNGRESLASCRPTGAQRHHTHAVCWVKARRTRRLFVGKDAPPVHQTAAEPRLGGGASHQSRGTSPRTRDVRRGMLTAATTQVKLPDLQPKPAKTWTRMRSRREFAIASVRAHDALVLRQACFFSEGGTPFYQYPVRPRRGAGPCL